MKNIVILMVLVAMVLAAGGCQASKSLCDDVAGTAAWCAEKLTPAANQAAENDADRAARKLAKRQAILSAQIALARQNEVQ